MHRPSTHDRRPLFHFTPPAGWLNDPNGMIYHEGEYHLCYQYHPQSLVWGPMHWGHAVSRDLAHWQHLPIALAPDEHGMIFSGSSVFDRHNSAGFGAGALVSAYTQSGHYRQDQRLAWSLDRGRSWTKYAGNPVIDPPEGTLDFRDPRLLRYEGPAGGHWVMLLAVGQEIWFYCSDDLKCWTKTGSFGPGYGTHAGVWECPDLVPLEVDGGPTTRWVLFVSVIKGGPVGGCGTQYFVGSFDGAGFVCDDRPPALRWADYGSDFYAAQSWADVPDGRAIWLAWMNNWDYARETPATTWRGMMSAPRELALASDAGGHTLVQRPARELAALRGAPRHEAPRLVGPGSTSLAPAPAEACELVVAFRAEGATAARYGLRVRVGVDEATTIGYDAERGLLFFDRSRSGQGAPGFDALQAVPLAPRAGLIELRLLLDSCSAELFADGGRLCLSNQIFPDQDSLGLALFADGGSVQVEALTVWGLG